MEIDQEEDNLLPGVEYNTVLSTALGETITCLGIVESISEGRRDLPISDSDWSIFIIGEDDEA